MTSFEGFSVYVYLNSIYTKSVKTRDILVRDTCAKSADTKSGGIESTYIKDICPSGTNTRYILFAKILISRVYLSEMLVPKIPI